MLPHCVCQPPVLPDSVFTDEDCENKLVGETCKLKCKQNFSIPQINFITCQTNGTWTYVPTCQLDVCIKPDFPRTAVVIKDDCSFKRIGETCTLECLKVPETYEIVCLNTTRWSTYPKCSCPSFISSKNMQFEEDCSQKKPREKCRISCKNSPELNKHMFITCLSNSEWSSEPLCDELICSTPVLPSYLIFGESRSQNIYIPNESESHQDPYQQCKDKTVGSTCEVSCKKGGNVIGSNIIVCLNTLKWSPFPFCSCGEPQIPEGIQQTRSCQNVLPGGECKLKCEENLQMLGNPFIQCLENLTWSSFPTCSSDSCSYPQVPERIIITEACTNKNPGETCKISCKHGGKLLGREAIVCLNKTHWTEASLCTCPKPVLNSNVKSISECEGVMPGNDCNLVCETNFEMSGRSTIICGNDANWSGLQPECKTDQESNLCQKPSLGPLLVAEDSCSSKKPGDVCTLTCKGDAVIIGNGTLKCLNTGTWSKLPDCGCSEPVLNADIESNNDCKNKIIGYKCHLKCKKGIMVGDPFIICQMNANWSPPPLCKLQICSKPVLPLGILEPTEDCSSKEVGNKCPLRCIEGGHVIGSDYIECLSESTWSKHPTCTCPDPKLHLPENLALEEECVNKTAGMQCSVTCKKSMKLTGNNFIECDEKTKWSKFPSCQKLYCPEPKLQKNVLISLKDCRFKTTNQTCELACKKGGKLIGGKFITCLNGIEWSAYPKCTCKVPVLTNDLKIVEEEDCNFKEPGMTCKLSCTDGKKISKIDFIICQNDTEWSALPKCQEAFCPKPNTPSFLTAQRDCSSTPIGQICTLNCIGGRKIVGENYMTCLSNLTWSPTPKCTCPPLHANSTLKGNCSSVIPGAKCNVTCKHSMAIAEREFIVCNDKSNWDNLNICKRKPCKNMGFPSTSIYVGRCENKVAGQTCKLSCRGSAVFFKNLNTITCTKDGKWPKPQKCVCRSIKSLTHLGLTLKEPCINKNLNQTCKIECINGLDLKDRNFIKCDTSFQWSPPPSCEVDFCQAPHIPDKMRVIEGNCSRLKIGESCKLTCINRGLIDGSQETYTLSCSADRKLNKMPTCTCTSPSLPLTLSLGESCERKEINDICLVRCNSDPIVDRYIVCLMQEEWMWSAFPDCPCTPPTHLNNYVTLEENCMRNIFPVNTTCNVTCGNFGYIVGAKHITCLPGSVWSESPSCTCAPPPIPPPTSSARFLNISACNRVLPGMSCPVSCTRGIVDKNFLYCNESFFWEDYPSCEIKCMNPSDQLAENFVGLAEDCMSNSEFPSGIICRLICLNGGEYISPPSIQCTDNSTWNSTAYCTCPKPELTGKDFAFDETENDECKNKFKGQECNFVCTAPGYAIKEDKKSLECEGKLWKGELLCERVGIWCPNPVSELELRKVGLVNGCSKESSLAPTTTCVVKCLTPGSVMMIPGQSISTEILQSEIRCSMDGTWLHIPQCSCYSLQPQTPYLLRENCDRKFHMHKCPLSLSQGFTFRDVDYVQCIDGSWGKMPAYMALPKCSKPSTRDALLLWPKECDIKYVNQTCNLSCRYNAFFMTTQLTTFSITCVQIPTGEALWSSFPPCACMNFYHPNYTPRDSCAQKRPGETCVVLCVRENAWGTTRCDAGGTWTTPVCA